MRRGGSGGVRRTLFLRLSLGFGLVRCLVCDVVDTLGWLAAGRLAAGRLAHSLRTARQVLCISPKAPVETVQLRPSTTCTADPLRSYVFHDVHNHAAEVHPHTIKLHSLLDSR